MPLCDDNKYYKLKIGKAIELMCKNLAEAYEEK
jgi:hypothetical protein